MFKSVQEKWSLIEFPEWHFQAAQENDGVTAGYSNASGGTKGKIFQAHTTEAVASAIHIAQTKGPKIGQVHLDILAAKAGARTDTAFSVIPTYAGLEAGAYLMNTEVSAFHAALGVAADSEIGYRDQSIACKLLGCGVRVGRIFEVSFLGTGFGVDFGKFF